MHIPGERNVRRSRVNITELALQRQRLQQAARPRSRHQRINRAHAQLGGEGDIAFPAQLGFHAGELARLHPCFEFAPVTPQHRLGKFDTCCRLGNARLHRPQLSHAHAGVGAGALAHAGGELLDCGNGRAQRHNRQHIGKRGKGRGLEQAVVVDLGPRRVLPGGEYFGRHAAMGRHKRVLDLDVVAAGAGEAERMPVIEAAEIGLRHQEKTPLGCAAGLVGHAAGQHPGRGIDAAGKRPLAREAVAAFHRCRLATRKREASGSQCLRVTVPHIFLRAQFKLADVPRVRGEVGVDPRGRRAGLADFEHGVHQHIEAQLGAAKPHRLHQAQQPCFVQISDGLGRHAAQALGFGSARSNARHQRGGSSARFGGAQALGCRCAAGANRDRFGSHGGSPVCIK